MDGGKLSAPAGRAMNGRREFSESSKIIAAFPNLPREGKLAAMGTFMLSGDTRFYPVIAPELDSADPDVRAEAIYAARSSAPTRPTCARYGTFTSSGKSRFRRSPAMC